MVLGLLLKLIPGFGTLVKLLGFLISVAYPTLESFRAIETKGTDDDVQWLTYWVVYSTLRLLEVLASPVLIWIPLYSITRLGALAWLVLPQFRGAAFVYVELVRPLLHLAADKLKEVGPVEPYIRDFVTKAKAAKAEVQQKQASVRPQPSAPSGDYSAPLTKSHGQ